MALKEEVVGDIAGRWKLLAPLRDRPVALLVAGQSASNIGDGLYAVALPWYVLAHHGGTLKLATVLAAWGVPRALFIPVGGMLSDRFSPWRTMVSADLARAVAVGILAVFASAGRADLAFLLPIAIVMGAGEGLFLPCSAAVVPALVRTDDLQPANALVTLGNELASILGPAVGGVIVAAIGADLGFAVDAGSFLISIATLVAIASVRRVAAARDAAATGDTDIALDEAPGAAAVSMLEVLRSSAVFRVVLLITVAANLSISGALEVGLPVLVRVRFHGGAGGYGVVVAAFSVGAVAGAIVAGSVKTPARPAWVLSATVGLGMLALAGLPYLGGVGPAGLAFAVTGALLSFGNLVAITAFQRWAPPHLLGRIMSLILLASVGVFPVSVMLGGLLVHALGASAAFPIAAAGCISAILVGLTSRSWREFSVD
jgi:predicted MFS family arabinose efflux permease